jgi:gas vesicle protein GvpN
MTPAAVRQPGEESPLPGWPEELLSNDCLQPEAGADFVRTVAVDRVAERALSYLEAGFAVHFAGPAGTGKTTLAFHVASRLGRPVILVHGDDDFSSADLVGRDSGYRRSKVVDNFVRSVVKTEENLNTIFVENRLTTACQQGFTLIYDEFNRSRPEANNVLLSVLEEGLLNVPGMRRTGAGYLQVHPEFRAIFTSNPEEYAGVHKTQDALLDRMITIPLGAFDRDTENAVVARRSGLDRLTAARIVDIVHDTRQRAPQPRRPTIRAALAIARMTAYREAVVSLEDERFRWVCRDVLSDLEPALVDESIARVCGVRRRA